jgi:divalent metal cation (Fe/Co/Zn/Cd) transporter
LLTIWTRRIIKGTTNPSPLLKAYYTDFKVALTSDSFLFLAFLSGYLLSTGGFDYLSIRVDPLLSVILSLYMLRVGVPLIIENTRSLIDLPLPEKEMLKILKVTTEFYREFTGFGMLYSRQSGKRKIVEMELSFSPAISLEQITEIENRIDKRINPEIPDVCFRIIPKISSCDEK